MSERRARVYQGDGEWGWYVRRTVDGKPLFDTSGVVGDNSESHYDAWFPDYEFALLAANAWTSPVARTEPDTNTEAGR